MGKILKESGYSQQTSRKPKLVTRTKGFQEELAKIMPDKSIAKKHEELIGAVKLKMIKFDAVLTNQQIRRIIEWPAGFKVKMIVRKEKCNQVTCYYWSPDYMTRLVAINMGYKIKNLYQEKGQLVNDTSLIVQMVSYASVKGI
ncbi:hypothetical protein KKC08_03125 [Patescibacteria group bacterium]|nr:hypothetical protein [Patescibacteria group bacterium]MCG2701756.1 hypothetical protein [Candidatus Parcubacteria bacterium]MBU4264661.1 hypothetical protein [Patescibacteria group bacterium]MBU4390616.1 hypothetical protein [Patescibacteria group bacterium]MBU4397131.1 hypothetical protein [Patescibacteria group bacterium]